MNHEPYRERQTAETVTNESRDTAEQSSTDLNPPSFPSRSDWRPRQVTPLRSKPKKQRGLWSVFFVGWMGGLLGAMTILGLLVWTETPSDYFVEPEPVRTEQAVTVTESDITKAVNEAKEAVVSIANIQEAFTSDNSWEAGTGSGVIYKVNKQRVLVVTNYHVIEKADELSVTLFDGKVVEANILGEDQLNDLAVLEVTLSDTTKIRPIRFGDSSVLQAGETVLAIGNPLGVFTNSVTRGIVSGVERTVPVDTNNDGLLDFNAEVIQTDAAINPGNSGGALVNTRGEIVGINSMKIAESDVEGVGFAIPINTAIPMIDMLEKNGKVTRPQLGITVQDMVEIPAATRKQYGIATDVEDGVFVEEVLPGSPAEESGLKVGDVITKIGDRDIRRYVDLRDALYRDSDIGDKITIEYTRGGEEKQTQATLVESK